MPCLGWRVRASLAADAPHRVAAELTVGFTDDASRHRAEPLAAVRDWRFEWVQPVRTFPSRPGQRHFPGLWWSSTIGDHVGFESWLEREHAMLLDFDPAMAAFSSQPFWLRWHDGARARRHAPDLLRADAGRQRGRQEVSCWHSHQQRHVRMTLRVKAGGLITGRA